MTPTPSYSIDEAAATIAAWRHAGKRVVFTNGVFDLLHPGHIRYLRAARAQGDVLIVAVNSDRSVRGNKGSGRPIVPQRERAEMLAALDMVDAVVIFDEPTPAQIIDRLRPDVLVKGGDWPVERIVGAQEVLARGGRVESIPFEHERSTTALVAKIRGA